MKIVAITGNVSRPSKTRALGEYALSSVSPGHTRYLFDLVDVLPALGTTLWRSEAPVGLANVLDAIQSSDVLIVGTPVFKSSMTGLLKHLFDLFEMIALQGKPVLIFATGKAEAHGQHVEAHLRSLMGFFKAEVRGDFIYAMDGDFPDSAPTAELRERVDRQLARTLGHV